MHNERYQGPTPSRRWWHEKQQRQALRSNIEQQGFCSVQTSSTRSSATSTPAEKWRSEHLQVIWVVFLLSQGTEGRRRDGGRGKKVDVNGVFSRMLTFADWCARERVQLSYKSRLICSLCHKQLISTVAFARWQWWTKNVSDYLSSNSARRARNKEDSNILLS